MLKCAIFLNGPIGVGKTTLGRALSHRLNAGFIDGDDHSDHQKPWYGSAHSTSRAIVGAGRAALQQHDLVVIAYPIGCVTWIYFRRHFAAVGVRTIFVGLSASYAAIVGERRGRMFSAAEKARIRVMLAEGYQQRPFSDFIVDTDRESFEATVDRLDRALVPALAL